MLENRVMLVLKFTHLVALLFRMYVTENDETRAKTRELRYDEGGRGLISSREIKEGGEDKTRIHVCGCMRHTVEKRKEGKDARNGRVGGRSVWHGAPYNQTSSRIYGREPSTVPGCVPIPHSCILSRSLLSTRDTGLLNLETLYLRPRLHTYTYTCHTRTVGWLRRREPRMAQIYCVL